MDNALVRLKQLATQPLWTEGELFRQRRRCRTLITTPFAMLGGLTWGVFSAPTIGAGSPLLWGVLGAVSFALFMYLEQRLLPPLAALADRVRRGAGALAGFLWEVGVVGGLVYLVTSVFDAPLVPAVGTALGVGAFYALVMEYVLCGSAASTAASLLDGSAGRGVPFAEQLSYAKALGQRGEYAEAERVYREAIERKPSEGAAYTRLARLLSDHGEHERAVDELRHALRRAKLTEDQEAFVVRQLFETCATKLGDASLAIEDLGLLIERQPDSVHAEWAGRELDEIEERFLAEASAPPRPETGEDGPG